MSEKTVLVAKPHILTKHTKTQLRKSGIIVVESEDLQAVRVFRAGLEMDSSDMLYIAMRALKEHSCSGQNNNFVKLLLEHLQTRKATP